MSDYTVLVDGGTSGGNPGVGVAAVILKLDGKVVHTESATVPAPVSNNQMEYYALLLGLAVAKRHGAKRVSVLCDSRLVVNQTNRKWAIHNLILRGLALQVWNQIDWFDEVVVRWVPRAEVAEADALLDAVRPADIPQPDNGSPSSLHDWLRNPTGLWFHLPDGRTLYKLTYYVQLAETAAPSIDFKIWLSLWARNRDCWLVWRPWGKYPLSGRQVQWGLDDLEDGIQQAIAAPLRKIRSEFLESPFVGKWGGRLLILRSDAWEVVDDTWDTEPAS